MQRLNIPLHRHTRTTRRSPRRVVWLLIVGAVFLLLFSTFFFTSFWFQRNTVFAAAPNNAVLALHFTPTTQNWPTISRALTHFPLISERSLQITDIIPFVQGEFAVFSTESGNFSLAVRSSKELLPTDLLDSYGISYQEVAPHIYLLSNTITPVGGWVEENDYNYTLPRFGEKKIGEFSFLDSSNTSLSGPIKINGEEIRIILPKLNFSTHSIENAPTSLLGALSMPIWTNTAESTISPSIQYLFSAYNTDLFSEFVSSFSQKPGALLLEYSNKLSYLYFSDEQFNQNQLNQLLKFSVALQNPIISHWSLPDGTIVNEIIADPSSIIVEEIPFAGSTVNHIPLDHDSDIYYANTDKGGFITNNETFLSYYLNGAPDEQESITVPNVLYFDLRQFFLLSSSGEIQRNNQTLIDSFEDFSFISIEEEKYSTTITFK
jgi:hypothetical protein